MVIGGAVGVIADAEDATDADAKNSGGGKLRSPSCRQSCGSTLGGHRLGGG